MNRKQWWASAIVFFFSANFLWAAMTADNREIFWSVESFKVGIIVLWVLATIVIVCFVCGLLEKVEGKKK